jgi:hypothetical protein
MQRKRCNGKNNKTKNKLSNLQNMGFPFFFLLFGPLLLSNLIIFIFLFILNHLNCYKSATWSSTNHIWTLIATEYHTKKIVSVQEPASQESAFVVFGCLFFFELLDPSTLGGRNFLIFYLFSTIATLSDVPRGGTQVSLGH